MLTERWRDWPRSVELESKRAELENRYPWLEKLLIIISQNRLWKVNQSEQRCCFWFHSYQKKIRCQMAIFVWRQIIKGFSFRIMKVEKLKMNTWTPKDPEAFCYLYIHRIAVLHHLGEGGPVQLCTPCEGHPWSASRCVMQNFLPMRPAACLSGPTLTYVEREVCSRDFLGLWSGSGICSGPPGLLT